MPDLIVTARESGPYVRLAGEGWARALDAVKGNCPPYPLADPRIGCSRWPEGWWLVNERTGVAVQGCCKATNLCVPCRTRFLRETAAVLKLASLQNPPTLYLVLTAREFLQRADCRRHLEHVRRAVRRHWPLVEWFVTVELQKRGALHLNLLVRGPLASEAAWFWAVAARAWCRRVDARAVAQHVEPITDAAGVARYVAKFQEYVCKHSQQPGVGWVGHRTSQSRGYFPGGIAAHRELVRSRQAWQVHYGRALDLGLRGLAAVSFATNERAISALDDWRVVDVLGAHLARASKRNGGDPVRAGPDCPARQCPASAVQGYVDYQRLHGRLFDEDSYVLRNRGPHTLTS